MIITSIMLTLLLNFFKLVTSEFQLVTLYHY